MQDSERSAPDVIAEIRDTLGHLVRHRGDVFLFAAGQRSKFEHWLKFELALALSAKPFITDVLVEDQYEQRAGRADLSFRAHGVKWYIELKTSNTSWRVHAVANKSRPITGNISSVIADIKKLRSNCPPHKGTAVFALFPVPMRIWNEERQKLLHHLRRIERQCNLAEDALSEHADFMTLESDFGVALFVVEAV